MDKKILPIAVLAGGRGMRLRPLTYGTPKSMLQVAGKPFIAYVLERFVQEGIKEVVLCVGQGAKKIESFVGDGRKWGLKIVYSLDREPLLGTGGAVLKALPLLGAEFLVQYGDTLLLCNYHAITKCFLSGCCKGLMTVYHNQNQWDKSNIVFKNNSIVQYSKTRTGDEIEYIDYGLLAFKKEAFAGYPRDKRMDLSVVCQDLIAEQQLQGIEVTEKFYEIGTVDAKKRTACFLESAWNTSTDTFKNLP